MVQERLFRLARPRRGSRRAYADARVSNVARVRVLHKFGAKVANITCPECQEGKLEPVGPEG